MMSFPCGSIIISRTVLVPPTSSLAAQLCDASECNDYDIQFSSDFRDPERLQASVLQVSEDLSLLSHHIHGNIQDPFYDTCPILPGLIVLTSTTRKRPTCSSGAVSA